MAKKVIVPQDAIEQWKETTLRASLVSYYNVDGILVSNNDDGKLILVVPDKPLLELLLDDKETIIQDYDLLNKDTRELGKWFGYGKDMDDVTWLPISDPEKFYNGSTVEIQIDTHEFPILISKELLPFKLKKAEFTEISYRVFVDPPVLGIRKRFEILPDYGFTMIRLFQVI